MTKARQKISERQFAREAGKMLDKRWSLEEHETPDFIVTEGAYKFGLEVRQIFTDTQDRKGSQSKMREARNQEHINAYRRKYEEKENALLRVQLVGDTCDENMGEVVQLLIEKEFSKKPAGYDEIFEVPPSVEDMIAANPESELHEILELRLFRYRNRGRLIVYVTRLPDSYTHCAEWYSVDNRVGWVGSASDQINSAIREKAKKLSEYKQNSVWMTFDFSSWRIISEHPGCWNCGSAVSSTPKDFR